MSDTRKPLTRSAFIKETTQTAKTELEEVINKYFLKHRSIDSSVSNLLTKFYQANQTASKMSDYAEIEKNCKDILNNLFKKSITARADYWSKLIGALYYILGTSQLAQANEKNLEALISFRHVFVYNYAVLQKLTALSKLYIYSSGDLEQEKIFRFKRIENLLDSDIKDIQKAIDNGQKNLHDIYTELSSKNENRYKASIKQLMQSNMLNDIKKLREIFNAWIQTKNKGELITIMESKYLFISDLKDEEKLILYIFYVIEELETCLNLQEKKALEEHEKLIEKIAKIIIDKSLTELLFIDFIEKIIYEIDLRNENTDEFKFKLKLELKNVLNRILSNLENDKLECHTLRKADIHYLINLISPLNYPVIENKTIEALIANLDSAIIRNDHTYAFKLQEDYQNYSLNFTIDKTHKIQFYLMMIKLYLNLRDANNKVTEYDRTVIWPNLEDALKNSENPKNTYLLVSTIFYLHNKAEIFFALSEMERNKGKSSKVEANIEPNESLKVTSKEEPSTEEPNYTVLSDFIKGSKQVAEIELSNIVNYYYKKKTIDDSARILLDKFYKCTKIDDYKIIAKDCSDLLEDIFQKSTSVKSYFWRPLIGALYYILGTCQLLQNDYKEAILSFSYSSASSSGDVVHISDLSSMYIYTSDVINSKNILRAEWIKPTLNDDIISKEKKILQDICTHLSDKILSLYSMHFIDKNCDLYDFMILKQNNIKNLFTKWNETKDVNILNTLVQSKYLFISDLKEEKQALFIYYIIEKLKAYLNFGEKNINNQLGSIANDIIRISTDELEFTTFIKNIINEINIHGLDSKLKVILKEVLEQILSQLKNNNRSYHSLRYTDINFLILSMSHNDSIDPDNLATLLTKLELAIFENRYVDAFNVQGEIERCGLNELNKAYRDQYQQFLFLLTILYFKLREDTDEVTEYDRYLILTNVDNALMYSEDHKHCFTKLAKMVSHFDKSFVKPNDKAMFFNLIKTYLLNAPSSKINEAPIHLPQKPAVNAIDIKSPIAKSGNPTVKNKSVTIKEETHIEERILTPAEARKSLLDDYKTNCNKRDEKKKKQEEIQLKREANRLKQIEANKEKKRVEAEKKRQEELKKQQQQQKKQDRKTQPQSRSKQQPLQKSELNQPETAQPNAYKETKIKTDLENKKLNFLGQFFSADEDEFELIDKLNHLIEGSPIIFTGSAVVKSHLLSAYNDEVSADKIEPGDIDAYLKCDLSNYQALLEILSGLGFTDIKTDGDIDLNNNNPYKKPPTYVNLKKPLKNKLKLDLTLKINSYNNNQDFIPLTGEAELYYANDKSIPILKVNVEKFPLFDTICRERKIRFEKPQPYMKSCAFRFDKFINRYKNKNIFQFDEDNINDVKNALREIYTNSLTHTNTFFDKKIPVVYLEIHDYIKHKMLPPEQETPSLALAFETLLIHKNSKDTKADVKTMIALFVSCKDDLHVDDKILFKDILFKEMVDLILARCLSGHVDLCSLRSDLKKFQLKSFNKQSYQKFGLAPQPDFYRSSRSLRVNNLLDHLNYYSPSFYSSPIRTEPSQRSLYPSGHPDTQQADNPRLKKKH